MYAGAPSQMTSMAVVGATGITATGAREVLGVDVGDSEDEVFWRSFLASLKSIAYPASDWWSATSMLAESRCCAARSTGPGTSGVGCIPSPRGCADLLQETPT